jgi:hypothetical protein
VNWSSLHRASKRWAWLLLVGGLLGFGLSRLVGAGGTGEPGTPVIVVTTIIPKGEPALPQEVEATRQALSAAAESGDLEALRALVPESDFTYSFGGSVEGGAIAYWERLERTTGERPLDVLAAILKMPYVLTSGIYVWPWAYRVESADQLSAHGRELLLPLGDVDRLFVPGTGYTGWRVGIRPDGSWAFFVAGD